MKQNYINLAIAKKCSKHISGNCFPIGIVHNCVQCHADQEVVKSEYQYLEMMAKNERNYITEW